MQDKFLDNIEKGFTSENYNTSGLESGKDDIIQDNKITITLTTTDNQKNSDHNSQATVQCNIRRFTNSPCSIRV